MNGSGKVVRAFACGVFNYGTNNKMPVCIEATPNGVKNDDNIALIESLHPNENYSCDGQSNCQDDSIMFDPDWSTVDAAALNNGVFHHSCQADGSNMTIGCYGPY